MQKLLLSIFTAIVLFCSCGRSGLKKYYTRISPDEFASYDSIVLATRSKYGKVHHVFKHITGNYTLNFLVFEKIINGDKKGLFKMDPDVEIRNDTTFALFDAPLLVVDGISNRVKGLWFYVHLQGNETLYSVDSLPHDLPKMDYNTLSMGIYQYKNKSLVKISSKQTEENLVN